MPTISINPIKVLLYLALALLGFMATSAYAGPPKSDLQATLNLVGEATKVGTIVSAGSSTTNASTATPFTLTVGNLYVADCDAAVHIGAGSAAHATLTNADYKLYYPAHSFWVWVATSTTIAMIPASGSANCAVFRLL